jgi:lipopolysaccharide transport system ATP-binding protein
MNELILKVENVSKKFIKKDGSEFWALKDVNFEIKKGESLGIIGPNGSGKSTLLKLLSGIIKPTTGTITFYGSSASVLDVGTGFHPDLTGIENIYLKGELIGKSKNEINQVLQKIIDFSELDSFINEPIKNYSSGMFVRLAFSTLLFFDFDMYLFDEVLSVGDQSFRDKIKTHRSLFFDDKTVISVSHDMSEIMESVQKVCFIKYGKIDFIGDKNKAIAKYIFERRDSVSSVNLNQASIELVKVNGLSCRANSTQLTIKKEDKIEFEIELNNYCEGELVITCNILTNTGSRIATDSHCFRPVALEKKINSKGVFSVTCTIPENLFNKGHFIIFLNSNTNDYNIGDWSNPFFTLELEVLHNEWEENLFFSKFTTPLQPYLHWEIAKK